tara:strand:+ start:1410 stop:2018 length:609 start_codon:yes stop_codon:yes gene_type:complete
LLKKLLFLFCFIACVSCPGYKSDSIFLNNKHKKIHKSSICDENKAFPQMIMIPFFGSASQVVPDCHTYPKYKTALALMVFYRHWLEWFGDDDLLVKNMLEKVMVEWGKEKKSLKTAYNIKGEKIHNATIIGITKTNSYIWVWEGYFHKISESSLMHELVHLALRAKNNHGDADHEGDKYDGWTDQHTEMILEAKETLRVFNI